MISYHVQRQLKRNKVIAIILTSGILMTVHSLLYKEITSPMQLSHKYKYLPYDDDFLLDHVRKFFLDPPSTENYNLKFDKNELDVFGYKVFMTEYSYDWCSKIIKELFENRPSGFFVEAGALDGEYLSNTLILEKQLGWAGLLVEVNDESYKELLGKHRKAWGSNSCLATQPHPHEEVLTTYWYTGENVGFRYGAHAHGSLFSITKGNTLDGNSPGAVIYKPVQCIPLGTLLTAISVTHVDFISLDVEGAELGILKNFPWGKISVDVWLVEHDGEVKSDSEKKSSKKIDKSFVDFFNDKGYKLYKASTEIPSLNYVFIKDTFNINIKKDSVL
ncbi:unnamed protein product [Meganyctiphanes norvegica]|uniref:Methyltransferase FkbM domain-containing protein n=1 Tax=Meganyctiphanes norvegica TaxID=48144 RepID=A0AAV2RFM0_MEGNR